MIMIVFTSCQRNDTKKVEITGKNILDTCIKHQGGSIFNASKITFTTKDVGYEMINYEDKVKYTMTKSFKDGLHIVTYDRGFVQYFRNDTLREKSSYNNLVVNYRLEKFLYTLSIPFNLTFNGTKVERLEDVKIRSTDYYSLHITFAKVEGIPENQFILYINKENNQMEYLTLKYDLLGVPISFRKFINPRVINGVLFQDFISFTTTNEAPVLEEIYKEYNRATLKDSKPVTFKNIEVLPLTENPFIE